MCDVSVRCDVPYCIVKSKARLGKLVNQKVCLITWLCMFVCMCSPASLFSCSSPFPPFQTVTAVAVTAVEKADEGEHRRCSITIIT